MPTAHNLRRAARRAAEAPEPVRAKPRVLGATATVKGWCNPWPYRVVIPAKPGRTYSTDGSVAILPQPEVYIAEVRDAYVTGGTEAVRVEDTLLSDMAHWPTIERYDLSSVIRPWMTKLRPGPTIPAGVMLQGTCALNYFHWIVEHLSRLQLLTDVPADVPLLLDREVTAVPQFMGALRALTNRKVYGLSSGTEYPVDHLYLPSPLAWMAPNMRKGVAIAPGDVLIAREAVAYLRKELGHYEKPTRKLYIPRVSKTAPARLQNVAQVAAEFARRGYEIVHPERMTFAEQRRVFGQAAVVAGESGAALTNILLAPPEATLVCIQAYACPVNAYADLAGHAGQRSVFIMADEHDGTDYQRAFTLNLDRLRMVP